MNEAQRPDAAGDATTTERVRAAFLHACELDVAVRKPGNVSRASPGHGMDAAMFSASAAAASGPLLAVGAGVGPRIKGAVRATLAVAGCNTNLGILLLCAPIAVAVERHGGASRAALAAVFDRLDAADAEAAFRAIAIAHPGGLGRAPEQDVHAPPTLGLRSAMALAAHRDAIARQYRDGHAGLFEIGLPALGADAGRAAALTTPADESAAVQRVYLAWLATWPDSHIVRKHGEAAAQNVMASAQRFRREQTAGRVLDDWPAFAAWDEALKAAGLNPGTSADLTVATLMLAGLL